MENQTEMEPFIRRALEEGLLFELNSVVKNAGLPIVIDAYICTKAFDKHINKNFPTEGRNAYTESVELLKGFLMGVSGLKVATDRLNFKFKDWNCRVVLHPEVPCLIFSEEEK